MKIERCVFCGKDESEYHNTYICSNCTQKILALDIEQVKELYKKSIEKGYSEKAEVLANYLKEVEDHGQKRIQPKQRHTRTRTYGTIRNQKSWSWRTKAKARTSISKNRPAEKGLS